MKCLKIDQLKWQKCWTAKKALGFILIWKNIPFPAIPAVNSHSEATEALPPVSSSLQTFLTLSPNTGEGFDTFWQVQNMTWRTLPPRGASCKLLESFGETLSAKLNYSFPYGVVSCSVYGVVVIDNREMCLLWWIHLSCLPVCIILSGNLSGCFFPKHNLVWLV